jgi:hypothetical protein
MVYEGRVGRRVEGLAGKGIYRDAGETGREVYGNEEGMNAMSSFGLCQVLAWKEMIVSP